MEWKVRLTMAPNNWRRKSLTVSYSLCRIVLLQGSGRYCYCSRRTIEGASVGHWWLCDHNYSNSERSKAIIPLADSTVVVNGRPGVQNLLQLLSTPAVTLNSVQVLYISTRLSEWPQRSSTQPLGSLLQLCFLLWRPATRTIITLIDASLQLAASLALP